MVGFETRWGYRVLEVVHGDLLHLGFPVDVLVFSSFPGNLAPLQGTLIAALEQQLGIDAARLARNAELDLTVSLGVWISQPIANWRARRVACIELRRESFDFGDALANLFSALAVLDARGEPVGVVALPLVGTGSLGIEPERIVPALLKSASNALERLANLNRVILAERDADKAARLSEAVDRTLGRTTVVLPKEPLVRALCSVTLSLLERVRPALEQRAGGLFDEMRRVLGAGEVGSVQIGVVARHLAELVVHDLDPDAPAHLDLARRIQRLREQRIAPWIQSYLHVLRHLGNQAAHHQQGGHTSPATVNRADLAICIFCIQRVVEFWIEARPLPDPSPERLRESGEARPMEAHPPARPRRR